MTRPSTKERARGRWREILPAIGINDGFLTGHNCPCPVCGGTDRFRFIDRRGQDGDGMWVCNQCQPKPRPAIDLVIAFTGKPFLEAARAVDDILGDKPVIQQRTSIRPPLVSGKTSYQHKRAFRRAVRITPGDLANRYLRSRGVGMDIYPPCLRFCDSDYYYEDKAVFLPENTPRYSNRPDCCIPVLFRIPAMVSAILGADGSHVGTHQTFLADDGRGKASVSTPRKTSGKRPGGSAIRLMPAAPLMGIAEGIETALSAARLFRIPVWSVLCAGGIEKFEPPPECQHLIVFADHDAHGVGQRAAEALCAKLQFPTEIKMPDKPGTDWNNVLLSEISR